MLNPESIIFDKWNVWCGLWFIPSIYDLNFLDNDGTLVAKLFVIECPGEWPAWAFRYIANTLPICKKAAFDSIVRAWKIRIIDELSTDAELSHRQNALMDD